MSTKEALGKSYKALEPFSNEYNHDFKRFLFSLDLLSSKIQIKNKKILDIGSGIGIMAMALKNLGADVTGVDKFIFPDESENFYSIPNFNELKRIWNENSLNVIKADAVKEKLPFDDGCFDVVICDATIEHLNESPKTLFKEAHRVLKDDGIFLVTTPNLANLLRRIRFLLGRSPNWDLKDYFESGSGFKGHVREFTQSELCNILEWSSFDVLEKRTKNIFFRPRKFLTGKKIVPQLCSLLSYPFPSMREMIYVLARKTI